MTRITETFGADGRPQTDEAPSEEEKDTPTVDVHPAFEHLDIRPASEFLATDDPEDGIYKSVPDTAYHSLKGRVSQSVLKKMETSAAHAKAQMQGDYDPSSSQRFGTAMHMRLLEPALFEQTYGEAGTCAGQKGSGDRCQYNGKNRVLVTDVEAGHEAEDLATDIDTPGPQHFCKTHTPDLEACAWAEEADTLKSLSSSRQEQMEQMVKRVDRHPSASRLLDLPGISELTVLWTDEPTGVKCKCRLDRLVNVPNLGTVLIDYKTTRNVEPGIHSGSFGYDAAKYGYHKQGGWYLEGAAKQGILAENYIIIAQEKSPPFDVVAYLLDHDDLEAGMGKLIPALREFADCQQRDSWPGIASSIVELELPSWSYE